VHALSLRFSSAGAAETTAMAAGRPHRSSPPQAPPTCPAASPRHPLPPPRRNRTEVAGIAAAIRRFPAGSRSSAAPVSPPSGDPRPADESIELRVSRPSFFPCSPPFPAAGERLRPASRAGCAGVSGSTARSGQPCVANVAWLVGLGPHCQPLWLG
jgi:hypothetical protein